MLGIVTKEMQNTKCKASVALLIILLPHLLSQGQSEGGRERERRIDFQRFALNL
jgi:hypothetical protein